MARFTFRLQPVLEHKQRLEDLAKVELAQRQALQRAEELALQGLAEAESNAVVELERQNMIGRLNIEALQLGMGYLDALKLQIQRQEQVVQRVQQQAEAKRGELVGRMQERKAMEQLRAHKLAAFQREEDRRETREADEMVVMRYAREDRYVS